MRVTNEELAQWMNETPTGLESGKLNFDQIRTYDIGLDLRDSRERVERLEAALREIKGESEAFQEYEHAAPDTFQRITILARAALAEPVAP